MIRLLAFMATMLVAWPAFSEPWVSQASSPKHPYSISVIFEQGDTEDSRAIAVSGFCSVRYQQASGDDASLYAVTTPATAASSGTLIGAFTSSTTTATTFTAGTRWVKAVATDATAGGSVMQIDCAPLTGGGGGGTGTYSVTSYGATGNGTTNDRVAINLAIDAACDAGGGIVFFPPGTYAVGGTGAAQFYSGPQVTCSNVLLLGVPFESELIPLFTHGGSLLNVCPAFTNTPAYGADQDCAAAANISNVRIEGLSFRDPDARDTCLTYSAATGSCSSEETHAIFVSECDQCVVTGNRVQGIGDEGIVFNSLSGGGGEVSNNFITGTPAIRGSAGSAIGIEGQNISVINNTIEDILSDPFGETGTCTTLCENRGAGIAITTSGAVETTDILVANNTLRRIDAWVGILAYANQDFIRDITISGNMVEMDSTDAYGCIETATYPGTPSRCSIKVFGGVGTPTTDRINVIGNTVTGGVISHNVDRVGSTNFSDNIIAGDEGRGIQAAGNPLTISGNIVQSFQGSGIVIWGLEDDDRTSAVLVSNNNLIGNNDDDTAEEGFLFYDPGSNSCGTDTIVPGGVKVDGNTFRASATASSLSFVVRMNNCVRGVVSNNVIDSLAAGTANNTAIYGGALITGNKIMNSASRAIYTDADNVVISDNLIETTGVTAIAAVAAADLPLITGNTIITANTPAIDAAGNQPTCIGNTSISTTAADRTIVCGTTAGNTGTGCTDDGADTGGICQFNQVCNTGDAAC